METVLKSLQKQETKLEKLSAKAYFTSIKSNTGANYERYEATYKALEHVRNAIKELNGIKDIIDY